MSKFTEKVVQKSTVNVYYPGSANCNGNTTCDASTPVATCSGCDWQFSTIACKDGCPSQPICSKIDGNVCPPLGSNITYEWASADGVCLRDASKNPLVACTYDANSFDYTDIVTYMNDFCTDTSKSIDCSDNTNFNNIIMPTFCFQNGTICPTIPDTESVWDICPNILSNIDAAISGNAGSDCTNWSNQNKSLAETSMKNYCQNNKNGVCNCINRTNSSVYKYIIANIPSAKNNPNLWFKPCANPQSYLVPPSLVNTSSSDICNQINEVIRKVPTGLTKRDLQAELNCNVTANPNNDPTGTTSGTSNNTNNTNTTSTSSSGFWIFVVGIIIILILIFFFFLAISS